jgi:hypothetical protein
MFALEKEIERQLADRQAKARGPWAKYAKGMDLIRWSNPLASVHLALNTVCLSVCGSLLSYCGRMTKHFLLATMISSQNAVQMIYVTRIYNGFTA